MDAPQRKQIPKPDDYKPDEKFAVGHRYEGRARCSGWNGTAGRQCLNLPAKARNVCRYHGGSTKQGAAHPNFTHGKYIKALSGHSWAARYVEHLDDPDRLSLTDEIALMRVRIEEILSQIDTTATLDVLERLESEAIILLKAFSDGDSAAIHTHTNAIYNMIVAARKSRSAEEQLDRHFDRTANLVTREAQRQAKNEELFTISTVIGMVVRLSEIFGLSVLKHTDARQADLILDDTEAGIDRQMLMIAGGR